MRRMLFGACSMGKTELAVYMLPNIHLNEFFLPTIHVTNKSESFEDDAYREACREERGRTNI